MPRGAFYAHVIVAGPGVLTDVWWEAPPQSLRRQVTSELESLELQPARFNTLVESCVAWRYTILCCMNDSGESQTPVAPWLRNLLIRAPWRGRGYRRRNMSERSVREAYKHRAFDWDDRQGTQCTEYFVVIW